MEQEQLKLLGFFGIFKESFKTIFSWKKIFSQITLAVICPLSILFLAHEPLAFFLSIKDYSRGTVFENPSNRPSSSNTAAYGAFRVSYFVFSLILTLLSTSAVVYTIACIYAGKQISFRRVMRVVPKVWYRLLVTFLWSFLIIFVYNVICIIILVVWVLLIPIDALKLSGFCILGIIYLIGFVYITVVWNLASVISVLEELRGLKAMKKAKELVKGKLWASSAILVVISLIFAGADMMFLFLSFLGIPYPDLALRIIFGIISFILMVVVLLVGLVTQTIIYFVCKSYHQENIDRSSLGYHLESYHGDYVRMKDNNVQMQQLNV